MSSFRYRIIVICALFAFWATAILAASIPPISYQGRLTNSLGNPVANGNYGVTFAIYADSEGGSALWTESHTVTTSSGLFTAMLGSMTPFDPSLFSVYPRYLGITIGAGPEMTPRILMGSVPYALNATSGTTGYWLQSGSSIYYNGGNVGIGTSTPGDVLEVNGSATISKVDGPRLTLKDNHVGQERPRISFSGDFLAIFDGDTSTAHVFSFMNTFSNVRNYDAILRVHGRTTNSWGTSLDLTHNGTHGIMSTDVGDITLAPANGSVVFSADSRWQSGGADRVMVDPNNRKIQVFGSNGVERARLCEEGAGLLVLYDSSLSTYGGALLSAVGFGGGRGGTLMLNDSTNALNVWMDAGASGNSSVILPDCAIDSREILDEPGISANRVPSPSLLTSATMQDLVTTTITTPGSGYILVIGSCDVSISGPAGTKTAYIQIDETAGGDRITGYTAIVGLGGDQGTIFSVFVQRVFYKPAGTYTFRMEGSRYVTGVAYMAPADAAVTAIYLPTSYGSVIAMANSSEAAGFDQATKVETSDVFGKPTNENMYQVDLRDLELKAAKARAEAERLERQVTEAKMKELQKQQNQTKPDSK